MKNYEILAIKKKGTKGFGIYMRRCKSCDEFFMTVNRTSKKCLKCRK